MWEGSGKVAIAGIGHSPTYRRWDERAETSLGAMAMDAVQAALDDCGLEADEVDGVVSAPGPLSGYWGPRPVLAAVKAAFQQTPGDAEDGISKVTAEWLARNLGLSALQVADNTAGMIGSVLNHAIELVVSGRCKAVVVLRPLNNFAGRYGHYGANAAAEASGTGQFTTAYGHSGFVSTMATFFTRYLWTYGKTHADLADLALIEHANGLLCDYGYFAQHAPEELTREQYLAGRWIAEPINIYDCDLPMQVAGAFVVTTAELARDLRQHPVYVRGIAGGPRARGRRASMYALEDAQAADTALANRLWQSAGIGPLEVDFANLYDAPLVLVPHLIETFGFCKPGEALEFCNPEQIGIGGVLPINPWGGNVGAGRSHGIDHIYEAVLQLRGQAGGRQIRGASVGVVHVGPPVNGAAQLLGVDAG